MKNMIHQYKCGGFNIVLDVCSGSVHVVDALAYDMIAEYENNSRDEVIRIISDKYKDADIEDISSCYEDITELKNTGKLFAPDTFANYCYELAKEFNQYYHDTPILKEENSSLLRMRLVLIETIANVLVKAMGILGIELPERM